MGGTHILRFPPPRTNEQIGLALARSLYIDGTIDVDEFEQAISEVLTVGRFDTQFGLPPMALKAATPSYSER